MGRRTKVEGQRLGEAKSLAYVRDLCRRPKAKMSVPITVKSFAHKMSKRSIYIEQVLLLFSLGWMGILTSCVPNKNEIPAPPGISISHDHPEYWRRFSTFLEETAQRDIVVQIGVWATFDFYRDFWDINPFNPKNNINYDSRRSKLSEIVDTHPIYAENNFFRSGPSRVRNIPYSFRGRAVSDSTWKGSLALRNWNGSMC